MFSFPVKWYHSLLLTAADMCALRLLPASARQALCQLGYSQTHLWWFYWLLTIDNATSSSTWNMSTKENGCFYANAVVPSLCTASSISQLTEQRRHRNLLQEHYLLAAPNITGPRAPGQGLDLGRDKESWVHSVCSQIQVFEKWGSARQVEPATDRRDQGHLHRAAI